MHVCGVGFWVTTVVKHMTDIGTVNQEVAVISWDEWGNRTARVSKLGRQTPQRPPAKLHHSAGSIAGSWPLCKVLPAGSALPYCRSCQRFAEWVTTILWDYRRDHWRFQPRLTGHSNSCDSNHTDKSHSRFPKNINQIGISSSPQGASWSFVFEILDRGLACKHAALYAAPSRDLVNKHCTNTFVFGRCHVLYFQCK